MEIKLKQRMLGIAVLAALAVIFLPMLMDGSNRKNTQLVYKIPTEPQTHENKNLFPLPDNNVQIKRIQLAQADTTQLTSAQTIKDAVPHFSDIKKKRIVTAANEQAVGHAHSANIQLSAIKERHLSEALNHQKNATIKKESAKKHHKSATERRLLKKQEILEHKDSQKLKQQLKKEKAKQQRLHNKQSNNNTTTWTVQIASFSDADNAKQLEQSLRAKGFPAYTKERVTDSGLVARVFVGPEIDKSKAMLLASDLQNAVNLKGIVLAYELAQS